MRWWLRNCRTIIDHMTSGCDLSGCMLDSRNATSARWLEWVGYHALGRREVNGHEFLEYVRVHASHSSHRGDHRDRISSDGDQ